MSTKQEILDQLVQDIMFYSITLVNASQKLQKAEAELAEWGYAWTPETGVQKLAEGEAKS